MGPILSRTKHQKSLHQHDDDEDKSLKPHQKKQLKQDLEEIQQLIGDPQYANHEQWKYEPWYKQIKSTKKVVDLITVNDIQTEYLQHIFRGNSEEAMNNLREVRSQSHWDKEYEHHLLMAFWLAIHKENIEVAQQLLDFDPTIRYLTVLAINGKHEPQRKKGQQKKPKDDLNSETPNQGSQTPAGGGEKILAVAQAPNQSQLQEEGGEINNLKIHHQFGAHLIEPDEFQFKDTESNYARHVNISARGIDDHRNLSQNEPLFFHRSDKKYNAPKKNQRGFSDSASQRNQDQIVDIFEGGDGSSNEDFDDDGESYAGEGEDEESEDAWNKEAPETTESDESGSDDDDDGKDKRSGAKKDGLDNQLKEADVPALNFSLEYSLKDLEDAKIYGKEIELTEIRTLLQLQKIKTGLQLRFPILMGNIIKILLHYDEEKLACFLTAYYEIELDLNMYIDAIENDHFHWLNYLWVFKKNYIGNRLKLRDSLITGIEYNSEVKTNKYKPKGHGRLLFNELFLLIEFITPSQAQKQEKLRKICEWYLCYKEIALVRVQRELEEEQAAEKNETDAKPDHAGDDNILKALLARMDDDICLEFMGFYSTFLDQELLLFALNNNNQGFVKKSLIMGAFDKQYFRKDEIVREIINLIDKGSSTLIGLNTLVLTDVSVWNKDQIQLLISNFDKFCTENFDNNNLLLCYNPLLAIALTAELLMICGQRKQFKSSCDSLKDEILKLGQIYNDQIAPDDEEEFKTLLYDVDFKNRTVLKIITSLQLEPLLSSEDPKSQSIMDKIYLGSGAQECDGNIFGFSTFINILATKPKTMTQDNPKFMQIITMEFQHEVLKVDYIFQHKYRSKSIQFFYLKDMFSGFVMTSITVYICMQFLETFKGQRPDNYGDENNQFKVLSDEERVKKFNEWSQLQIYQYGVSGALTFSFILRLIFNAKIDQEVINPLEIDSYVKFDILFAVIAASSQFLIVLLGADQLKQEADKDMVDYLITLVMFVALGRFFQLFLVVENVSKMLLTLYVMILDVWPFAIIMLAYYLFGTQVFSTIYQDYTQNDWGYGSYHDIFDSLTATYDATLGAYDYMNTTSGLAPQIFTFLQIINLFFINILMLNFMVAILSTTYENMLESGSFKYKCTLFEYCEKYMIAQDELNNGIGEIVVHPPPINLLCTLIFPFLLLKGNLYKENMPKICEFFSKANFWMENIFFILAFIIFELLMSPFVYLKTFYTITYSTEGMFTTVANLFYWTALGVVYLVIILLKDTYVLMEILYLHEGCRSQQPDNNQEEEDDLVCKERRLVLFNEIRYVVIKYYLKERYRLLGGAENKNLSSQDLEPKNFENILKLLDADAKDARISEQMHLFQVKYVVLQDEWKTYSVTANKGQSNQPQAKKQKDEEQDVEEELAKENNEANRNQEQEKKNEVNDDENMKKEKKKVLLQDLLGGNVGDRFQEEKRIVEQLVQFQDGQDVMAANDGAQEGAEQDCDPKEVSEVERILKKFVISSETSSGLDTIDITLMMKAIPQPISMGDLHLKYQFNFIYTQDSLTACQNEDQVQAFEFYDGLNSKRVQKIRQCILNQRDNLLCVQTIMECIKKQVEHQENTIAEVKKIWDRLDKQKRKRMQEQSDAQYLITQSQIRKPQTKGKGPQKKTKK